VIVKLALVVPAAMVRLLGTCATDVLLLCKVTTAPPLGAAAVNVTVPVELAPPTTVVGVLVIEDRETFTALMLRVAVLLIPSVAVMVAEVLLTTVKVLTPNVVEVLPAGTVTEAGTVAAPVLLLCRETLAPPVGAGPVRVTVPVELAPPETEVGLSARAETVAGFTVSEAPA